MPCRTRLYVMNSWLTCRVAQGRMRGCTGRDGESSGSRKGVHRARMLLRQQLRRQRANSTGASQRLQPEPAHRVIQQVHCTAKVQGDWRSEGGVGAGVGAVAARAAACVGGARPQQQHRAVAAIDGQPLLKPRTSWGMMKMSSAAGEGNGAGSAEAASNLWLAVAPRRPPPLGTTTPSLNAATAPRSPVSTIISPTLLPAVALSASSSSRAVDTRARSCRPASSVSRPRGGPAGSDGGSWARAGAASKRPRSTASPKAAAARPMASRQW